MIVRAVIGLILLFPLTSHAVTDAECLKHLGGAFAAVECYNGLSKDIAAENNILINKIAATIPKGNINKVILKRYVYQKAESKKYCQLSRDSLTEWVSEKQTINPRYYDYDVAYYECIFNILGEQNTFLKNILKNVSGE